MGLTPAKRPVALMSAPELPEGRYETWPVSRRKHLALLADDYSMPFGTHAADGAMPLLSAEGWRRRHAHGWLMLPRAQPLPARGAALSERRFSHMDDAAAAAARAHQSSARLLSITLVLLCTCWRAGGEGAVHCLLHAFIMYTLTRACTAQTATAYVGLCTTSA